jgi:uncharacterized protein YeaO (DUF488 family)
MKISTKSLQSVSQKKDGLRVLIMRRIKPEYQFDLWIPHLSPPEPLFQKYVINKSIDWKTFSEQFAVQVLAKQKKLLEMLVYLSHKQKITLLCWEKTPYRCHRILVLKACREIEGVMS